MIRSYANAATRRVHRTGNPRGFKGLDGRRAVMVLDILEAADNQLSLPKLRSFRVHALRGDRRGELSITVNLPWTVCFKPHPEGGWADVKIDDYHKG